MTDFLDAEAAGRVLRRANALAGSGTQEPGGYHHDAIIAAAGEVGIPERVVRESLAIEVLGAPPPVSRSDRLLGPAVLHEQCLVPLPPDLALELIDRWLVAAHHLRRERRCDDEMQWTRRDDFVGALRRRISGLAGEGRLGRASQVNASVCGIDAQHTMVRVVIDRGPHHRAALWCGSSLGLGAVSLVVVGVVLAPPVALLAIPAAVVGVVIVSASRREADRFERELGRLLDAVRERRGPQGIVAGVRRRLTLSAST